MGCSNSRSNKANEIAIRPKVVDHPSSKPQTNLPQKPEPVQNPPVQAKEANPPKSKETDKNSKKDSLNLPKHPETSEPEEGFGIIRTVSSKPGHVSQVSKQTEKPLDSQISDFLSSVYSSIKTQFV